MCGLSSEQCDKKTFSFLFGELDIYIFISPRGPARPSARTPSTALRVHSADAYYGFRLGMSS